jgi:hypothetical protein
MGLFPAGGMVRSAHGALVFVLLGLGLAGLAGAQDTTFLSGEEMAAQLRQNLVWIAAQDIGEHGYGLVVGGDAQTLWVLTARHVVVKTAMLGSPAAEVPSRQIRLRFCAAATNELLTSEPWPGWDAGGEDIALLSVARPRAYQPVTRALASKVVVGEPVWLLGSNDECSLVPVQGQVRVLADAAHNLRIDFAGVQGGSSGAPVLSGFGVLGLMKSAEDLTTTVHAVDDLQRRLQALPSARWELVDARNIPPTDPRAAEIDLAETLNQYLLVLRNIHMLLRQRQIARPTLDDYMQRYNAALRRFLRVREAYDGSLNRNWPTPVWPAWRDLRENLWAVHQNFWRINPLMADIYQSQQSSAEGRAQMASLEPDLVRLEFDIAQFLRLLAKEH